MQGRIGHTKLENWLSESGLEMDDMQVTKLGIPVRNALSLPQSMSEDDAVVIPYFDINGARVPYYRVRLLTEENGSKYRQAKDSETRVYFPRKFGEVLRTSLEKAIKEGRRPILIMTEGEKKAACAVKNGIPAIAFGGVWNWRSKSLELPYESTKIKTTGGENRKYVIKSEIGSPTDNFKVAEGMREAVTLLKDHSMYPVIIYDTDEFGTVKRDVQNAAAFLGFELINMGIKFQRIKQVVIPNKANGSALKKVGLDDYLNHEEPAALMRLIYKAIETRVAFPRFPDVAEYLTKNSVSQPRDEEATKQALMLFIEMEYRGIRCKASMFDYFYQIPDQGIVIPVDFPTGGNKGPRYNESAIYGHLYNEYGITPMQEKTIRLLAPKFAHEHGIVDVVPTKIVTTVVTKDDNDMNVASQASDHTMIFTSTAETKIELNGSHSVLFLPSELYKPIKVDKFLEALKTSKDNYFSSTAPQCYWKEVAFRSNITGDKAKTLYALLMYIWPWLRGWRNFQMPIVIWRGEHESGKTTLAELIQYIMLGRTALHENPKDIRDLKSFAASEGGPLFFDNLGTSSKQMEATEDLLSLLATASDPEVSTRKMYREFLTYRQPVQCVFGFTSINPPFKKADFISRSMIFDFQGTGKYQHNWVDKQLEMYGGREGWLAHHHVFFQKFFTLYDKQAEIAEGRTFNRMKGIQAALETTAIVFGMEWEWIGPYLLQRINEATRRADQVLQALEAFLSYWNPAESFKLSDFVEFARGEEDFEHNTILQSASKLAAYFRDQRQHLKMAYGIVQNPVKDHNVTTYRIEASAKEDNDD